MNGRIMKKDEFRERMLADQEIRRERKAEEEKARRRRERYEYIDYAKDRRTRIQHHIGLQQKSKGVKGKL